MYKRLRTLKKRQTKIEKYEELPQSQLNADQLAAVGKKQEVVSLIRELDELAVQLSDKDAEEKRSVKKLAKLQVIEHQKAVAQAVADARADEQQKLRTMSKLIVAVAAVMPRIPSTVVAKVNKQLILGLY